MKNKNPNIIKHKDILEDALDLFFQDNSNCYCLNGKFIYLTNFPPNDVFDKKTLLAIPHYLYNIIYLCTRLQLYKDSTIEKTKHLNQEELIIKQVAYYRDCSVDIINIFMQYRSLCDQFIKLLAVGKLDGKLKIKSSKVKNGSFNDVYKDYNNKQSCYSSDDDIYDLFKKNNLIYKDQKSLATWFGQMRATRDGIVHLGHEACVMGNPSNGIVFQVYSGVDKIIQRLPHIKFNDHALYFEKYFALQFSSLLLFAESLACLIENRLYYPLNKTGVNINGCSTIYQWISNFHDELNQ